MAACSCCHLLSCELLYRLVAVTVRELDEHYKDFVRLLWSEKKQEK